MSSLNKIEVVSAAASNPSNPLLQGRPAGQRQVIDEVPPPPLGCYGSFLYCMGTVWGCIGTATVCLCPPYKTIQQGEFGVVTQFGRYARVVEPGLVYYTPFVEEIRRVDTRLCTLSLERQMTLSKDNITLYADIVLLYRVINVHQASFQVQNLTALLQQCAYSTIRQVFGTKTLQELLEKRHEIAADVYSIVENDARNWGVHIDQINIKDLILPENMVRVLRWDDAPFPPPTVLLFLPLTTSLSFSPSLPTQRGSHRQARGRGQDHSRTS
jgi:SPFH domain / Band 7 family